MKTYVALILLMTFPGMILSASTSRDDLILTELQSIKEHVQRLEEQVAQLQDQLVSVTADAVQSGTGAVSSDSGNLVQRVAEAIYQKEDQVNFPWMEESLWNKLEEGMSEAQVLAILGKPTLNEPSLHKRVDVVYTYRGRRASTGEKVIGKIKFYKDKAIEIQAP